MPGRIALLMTLLPIAALRLPAQQPPVTNLQARARQVVLDVVVTDRHGNPVKGLQRSDFILSEDGTDQTLAAFTERDAAATPPSSTPGPKLPPNTYADHAPVTNDTAMTVLLFDTSQLAFNDAAYARDQTASFVKSLPPGTPIGVFDLDPWGLQLVQDFTADPQLLRQAIQSKRNAQKPATFPEFTPVVQRGIAMRQLGRYLSGFPGRKNLIWFYGVNPPPFRVGQANSLFPDMTSFTDDLKGITDTLTLSRVALYPVDPRGVPLPLDLGYSGTASGLQGVNPGVRAIGGSPPFSRPESAFFGPLGYNVEDDIGEEVLRQGAYAADAAKATGGKAFYNNNGIKQIVAEVVATGSHYYTLAYRPSNANWDGSFRKIKVRMAAGVVAPVSQPELKTPFRLEYRAGYFAGDNASSRSRRLPGVMTSSMPRSYSAQGALSTPTLQEAMSFGAIAPFQILFRAQVTPAPATEKIKSGAPLPNDNYLHDQWRKSAFRDYRIHYSVDSDGLRFAPDAIGDFHNTTEFVAVVYDVRGAIVNSIITTLPFDVNARQMDQIRRVGFGFDQTIAVPAHGDFYLRLGIQDPATGRIGSLEVPVQSIKIAQTP